MTDQLISFDTAVLAKEKGFNWTTDHAYWKSLEGLYYLNHDPGYFTVEVLRDTPHYAVCLQSLLAKWLRDVHKVFVTVRKVTLGSDEWEFGYEIEYLPKGYWEAKRRSVHFEFKESFQESPGGTYWGAWPTYEQALEYGLVEGLKLLG